METVALRLEALKLRREWGVWMVAVQTAVVGFLVSPVLEGRLRLRSPFFNGAILGFGLSIALAACVLGAIPSLVQRLPSEERNERNVFRTGIVNAPLLRRVPLGWFSVLQHLCFLLGLLALLAALVRGEIG